MNAGKRDDSLPDEAVKPTALSGESGCPFHVRMRNMRDTVVRAIVRFPAVPMAYGRCRQALSRHPLPPGELVNLDACERGDQRFLLERFQKLGPIFKGVGGRRLQVCIVGLPRCREFLKAHGENLTQVTVKLESLFPGGFLRKMRGDQHRKYRQVLLRAIDPELVSESRQALEEIIDEGLRRYVAGGGDIAGSAVDYKHTMSTIMTGLLVHLFFGAPFGSPAFEELLEAYRRLGPEEFEWWIGPEQKRQYLEIRGLLLRQLSQPGSASEGWLENCILRRMNRDGTLDETSLGHLIYMVEMGRFDMYSLFRWLSKFASGNPQFLPRIAEEGQRTSGGQTGMAEAFVMETLRLVQSERLMRVANRDLIFEGYLIPRFSSVRLCLWESHKAPETFVDPFAFNPYRFLDGVVTGDQYAPFGLDQHICPVADINIQLSTLFVRILAARYSPETLADGEAVRGRYHWEPAEELNVNLRPRLAN